MQHEILMWHTQAETKSSPTVGLVLHTTKDGFLSSNYEHYIAASLWTANRYGWTSEKPQDLLNFIET